MLEFAEAINKIDVSNFAGIAVALSVLFIAFGFMIGMIKETKS